MDKLQAFNIIDSVISKVNATRDQHIQLQEALNALRPESPKEDEAATE
jgi:hypothetical protein